MNKILCLVVCSILTLTNTLAQSVRIIQSIDRKKEYKLIKPSPLYILNDIELKDSLAFTTIDAIDIEKMEILNGEQGLLAYGKKGINGVVMMTTKLKKTEISKEASFGLVKQNPLYILDNVELKDDSTLSSINPADISRINVLKSKADIEPYGEKGKNGVVIITTKRFEKSNLIRQ